MKFIQCKSCRHFSPISSEYQIFCDACGKKNPDNFKAWQQKNPNKNLEDFKNTIGVDKIKPEKTKKKLSLKQLLQILVVFTFVSIGYYFGRQQGAKLYLFFHDLAFPISELLGEEWKRQYFAEKQISLESPFLLKEMKIEDQFPKEIKDVIVKMENYASQDNIIFNIAFSVIDYHESVKALNLKGGSDGAIAQMMKEANGTDLYYSDTDTFVNQYPAITKTGNFISEGNTIYFKNIICVKNNLTGIQIITMWTGEDENYKLLSDRIINSLDVR